MEVKEIKFVVLKAVKNCIFRKSPPPPSKTPQPFFSFFKQGNLVLVSLQISPLSGSENWPLCVELLLVSLNSL